MDIAFAPPVQIAGVPRWTVGDQLLRYVFVPLLALVVASILVDEVAHGVGREAVFGRRPRQALWVAAVAVFVLANLLWNPNHALFEALLALVVALAVDYAA